MLYSFPDKLVEQSVRLVTACRKAGLTLATAESCTGGLIAAILTETPGSSDVFERGYVTYANLAKIEMLGVPEALLAAHGAVSAEVAAAMAEGAARRAGTDLAVSVTGIAGPGGATETKPVGLVFVGAARRDGPATAERHLFTGGRTAIRQDAVAAALAAALRLVGDGDE
jgi:nicotinamide-nucleotide amidase